MNKEGLEKAAMLLLSIGEDQAAEVLKHLPPREVQSLGLAMANLQKVPRERIEAVLDDMESMTTRASGISADEPKIRSIMTKALGEERAAGLLARIFRSNNTDSIDSLKWMDAVSIADMVRNEHPQIIAAILAHLEYDHAGEVLKLFTDRLRNDVLLRLATLDGVQPQALHELNEAMATLVTSGAATEKTSMGGVRHAAEILNFVGHAHETTILDNVREYDPDLAQKIMDEMFVFDNLIDVDDRGIQLLLREVQSESLIVALKGATPELREKVFKNMSQRAAEMLREDLEARGPVRVSEVETEQKEILKVARRLADEGQIQLGGGGGDDAFI